MAFFCFPSYVFVPSKTQLLAETSHHPHLVSAIHIHLRPNLAGIPLDSMSQDQFNSPKKMAVQSTNKMSIERIETWRKTRFVTISKHVFFTSGLDESLGTSLSSHLQYRKTRHQTLRTSESEFFTFLIHGMGGFYNVL